jgi:hypothetical protein
MVESVAAVRVAWMARGWVWPVRAVPRRWIEGGGCRLSTGVRCARVVSALYCVPEGGGGAVRLAGVRDGPRRAAPGPSSLAGVVGEDDAPREVGPAAV